MKKTKKYNLAHIKALLQGRIQEIKTLTFGEGENVFTVNVTPVISFKKRIEMIGTIIGMVFANDCTTIEGYMPAYLKFAKRYAALTYFTDISFPPDLNDSWLILNHSDLYEQVKNIVGKDIDDIFSEADEAIKAKRDYLVNKTDLNKFLGKITSTMDSMGSQLSGVDVGGLMNVLKNVPNLSSEDLVKSILKVKDADAVNETK